MWLVNSENLLRLYGCAAQASIQGGDRSGNHDLVPDKAEFLKNVSIDDPTVEYAILSHTWAPGGTEGPEVSFREMAAAPRIPPCHLIEKSGFRKIIRTCELALEKYGLRFVWVDTCCIDKSSSAELSEAINSMFRFYQRAAVCIAFLDDWEPPPSPAAAESVEADIDVDSLRSCRWFTRGWTLQELIAPREVDFYDKSWQFRGDKRRLAGAIEQICRIDRRTLACEVALSEIPVAVRMSWAAGRCTTREEDEAYCLLGIFDVNMPMLYGEGRKAFFRLQEEIIKENPDMSIFAWRDPAPALGYAGILSPSPSFFADAGGLRLSPDAVLEDFEFSVTNQGLKFRAPLGLQPETGYFILPVNHSHAPGAEPPTSSSLGIYLRQVGRSSFVRALTEQLAPLQDDGPTPAKSILVAKTLSRAHALSIDRRVVHFRRPTNLRIEEFGLTQVEPVGCWDASTSRLFSGYGSSFLGYMRFEPKWAEAYDFFVLVFWYNASKPDAERWEYDLVRGDDWVDVEPRFYDSYRHRGRGDAAAGQAGEWPNSLVLHHLFDEKTMMVVTLSGESGTGLGAKPEIELDISNMLVQSLPHRHVLRAGL
jgi:hypothetical protein